MIKSYKKKTNSLHIDLPLRYKELKKQTNKKIHSLINTNFAFNFVDIREICPNELWT